MLVAITMPAFPRTASVVIPPPGPQPKSCFARVLKIYNDSRKNYIQCKEWNIGLHNLFVETY